MAEWMDELERLAELRDKGLVTEHEFEVKRQEILNSSPEITGEDTSDSRSNIPNMYFRLPDWCWIVPWLPNPNSKDGNSWGYFLAVDNWKDFTKDAKRYISKLPRSKRIQSKKIKLTPLGYEIIRGHKFLRDVLDSYDQEQIGTLVETAFHNIFHPELFPKHSPMPDFPPDLFPKETFRIGLTINELITELKPPTARRTEFIVMNGLWRSELASLLNAVDLLNPFEKECLRLFGIYGLGIPSHEDWIAENVCLILPYLEAIDTGLNSAVATHPKLYETMIHQFSWSGPPYEPF